jgi:hypothetical protein
LHLRLRSNDEHSETHKFQVRNWYLKIDTLKLALLSGNSAKMAA